MLTLDRLTQAVREDAAIRRIRKLQPVGGAGDKIFPPTYPGARRTDPPRHVFEYRRLNNQNVLCVLIDSVQSQANRHEEALKAVRGADVAFPVIAVDFSKTEAADIGQITSLDAPHRVFDAIIRDSELGKKPFRETEDGKRLIAASARNARAVYELSPTALVFGAWNSTGEGGGLGAKFPRCVVSEIVGVGVATEPGGSEHEMPKPSGKRTGSRIDPLGIRSGVTVYKLPNGDWDLKPTKAKGEKEARPSEVNHSNIAPSVVPLGVTIDYALHTFVLSFSAVRRLNFEVAGGRPGANEAAHTALAALALVAATASDRVGYFLRSRCELVPEEGPRSGFEFVKPDGAGEAVELSFDVAKSLLSSAMESAAEAGAKWREKDLLLTPQPKLAELVRLSREMALQGAAATED